VALGTLATEDRASLGRVGLRRDDVLVRLVDLGPVTLDGTEELLGTAANISIAVLRELPPSLGVENRNDTSVAPPWSTMPRSVTTIGIASDGCQSDPAVIRATSAVSLTPSRLVNRTDTFSTDPGSPSFRTNSRSVGSAGVTHMGSVMALPVAPRLSELASPGSVTMKVSFPAATVASPASVQALPPCSKPPF